jgi:hypothetical protein
MYKKVCAFSKGLIPNKALQPTAKSVTPFALRKSLASFVSS